MTAVVADRLRVRSEWRSHPDYKAKVYETPQVAGSLPSSVFFRPAFLACLFSFSEVAPFLSPGGARCGLPRCALPVVLVPACPEDLEVWSLNLIIPCSSLQGSEKTPRRTTAGPEGQKAVDSP